jgi:gamma-glutamyl:cysteine ligase YbdK (ATP-grasp superfamily)
MLISDKVRRVVAVVLIHRPHLQLSISKGSDPYLNGDDSGLWCKRALVEGDIKVNGTERKNVEHRLLAHRFTRHRRYEQKHSDQKS